MSESLMEKYHQLLQWRNDTGRKLNSTVRVNNKSYIITGRGSPSWKTSLEILRKKSWGSCLSETLPLSLHSGFPNWISPPPPAPPRQVGRKHLQVASLTLPGVKDRQRVAFILLLLLKFCN